MLFSKDADCARVCESPDPSGPAHLQNAIFTKQSYYFGVVFLAFLVIIYKRVEIVQILLLMNKLV